VTVDIKAAGKTDEAFGAVAKANIGVRLGFKSDSSVVMVYRGVIHHAYEDEPRIGDAMVKSWDGGPLPKMDLGDFAVTQMLVADWGFVFGAKSSSTSVLLEFSADAKIPDGASLGSLKGHFGVVREHETDFRAYSPGGGRGVVLGYRGLLLTKKGILRIKTVAEPKWQALRMAERYALDGDGLPEGTEALPVA
jgi:hypothetical protein